jgi:hypothetical protein
LEEEWHIFFECEATKEAWHYMGLNHIIQARMNNCHDISELIFDICRNEDKQVAGKVAVMFWCMWQNRNNYVWNNNKISAQQIGMQAEHIWHEWAMVQGLLDDQQHHEQQLIADRTALQVYNSGSPHLLAMLNAMLMQSFLRQTEQQVGDGVSVTIEGVSC